jgi:hypothetical protein
MGSTAGFGISDVSRLVKEFIECTISKIRPIEVYSCFYPRGFHRRFDRLIFVQLSPYELRPTA